MTWCIMLNLQTLHMTFALMYSYVKKHRKLIYQTGPDWVSLLLRYLLLTDQLHRSIMKEVGYYINFLFLWHLFLQLGKETGSIQGRKLKQKFFSTWLHTMIFCMEQLQLTFAMNAIKWYFDQKWNNVFIRITVLSVCLSVYLWRNLKRLKEHSSLLSLIIATVKL